MLTNHWDFLIFNFKERKSLNFEKIRYSNVALNDLNVTLNYSMVKKFDMRGIVKKNWIWRFCSFWILRGKSLIRILKIIWFKLLSSVRKFRLNILDLNSQWFWNFPLKRKKRRKKKSQFWKIQILEHKSAPKYCDLRKYFMWRLNLNAKTLF